MPHYVTFYTVGAWSAPDASAEEDAFDFKTRAEDEASVDYDDDGDLDLFVINSPGGDNALHRDGGDELSVDVAADLVDMGGTWIDYDL